MGRAVAHGRVLPERFSDPTALALLSSTDQQRVERVRRGERTFHPLRAMGKAYLLRQALAMVARTVFIDDAVREANAPQLVILGAGLDGRAYRMSELKDAVVFEVDHPDTQRDKKERAAKLTHAAREVKYVPVNFERDSLEQALTEAGHDASRPTTWIWEGVVMYLDPADVEATLKVIAQRSAPKSRLVINYHQPLWIRPLIGLFVRAVGEPLKSHFTPDQIRALLARYRFEVKRDQSVYEIFRGLDPVIAQQLKRINHLRLAVGDLT
jgi:methyltransferase (TIGR00027 family)